MNIVGSDYNLIREQIKKILSYDKSIVVDVNCHDFHDYNPKVIGWQTPIEDMYPYLEREEFFSNMVIEPTNVSIDFKNLVRPVKSYE